MKTKFLTYSLLAAAIAITPVYATDKDKHKEKPAEQKKAAPCAQEKKCLDDEIRRVESALDRINRAVGSQMQEQASKLAASEAALNKAKAESADLQKRVAAAEANAKNITTEFNNFKASNEKQRKSTMASLAKIQEASQHTARENAELKKKNQQLEAHCKAACERLKAIADKLEAAEKKHAAHKK